MHELKTQLLRKEVTWWPNEFQESTDFHGLGGARSKIAVRVGIQQQCRRVRNRLADEDRVWGPRGLPGTPPASHAALGRAIEVVESSRRWVQGVEVRAKRKGQRLPDADLACKKGCCGNRNIKIQANILLEPIGNLGGGTLSR